MVEHLELLGMNGTGAGCQRCFFDGLREGGMSMAGPGDVLSGGPILHGHHTLLDQFTGSRAHDVSTQDLVSLCICHEFDQALRVLHTFGAAVGSERELTSLHARQIRKSITACWISPDGHTQEGSGELSVPCQKLSPDERDLDLVVELLLLGLLLSQAYGGHFWMSVHDAGHSGVVDMTCFASQILYACHTIFLCLHASEKPEDRRPSSRYTV